MRLHQLALLLSASSSAATEAVSYGTPWVTMTRRRVFSSLPFLGLPMDVPRGGADSAAATSTAEEDVEEDTRSLDDKVRDAMKKFGIDPDSGLSPDAKATGAGSTEGGTEGVVCEDGICEVPPSSPGGETEQSVQPLLTEANVNEAADRISSDLSVDRQIALAALGATSTEEGGIRHFDEDYARQLILAEQEAIRNIAKDCDEVKQLASEGHDALLVRRALAFADMNVDNARAILVADQEDADLERMEYDEEQARIKLREEMAAKAEAETKMKEVKVDPSFDPTQPVGSSTRATGLASPSGSANPTQGPPLPANKEDFIFDITTEQIQEIVLESPVPVLLDVYADWCGPCKALSPALEQMAVNAGGAFRLVKINSDNERTVSQALEVTALPTVFAIRQGKILNMFQGMPRDEEMMKNFMMGLLMPGSDFKPPVTDEQKKGFAVLGNKLVKVGGTSSLPFSVRERLQDRTVARLDDLVHKSPGNLADAEECAKTVRSLLSNIVRDPYDAKYRRINLGNKVVAARIAAHAPCMQILKSVGFSTEDGGGALVIGNGKKVVNVAPLLVTRDCIDKWIDRNRYEIAKAARQKRDEVERARLAEEGAFDEDEYDSEEEEEEEKIDPDACTIKLRIEGKKKVHELAMRADDTLSTVIDRLPGGVHEDGEVQITCTAKRLIVKSSNAEAMSTTLMDHGLLPASLLVVKTASANLGSSKGRPKSSLAERAKARKGKKKGSHTMASIGIYSKDDNAKGELIDMGGGVWMEHDITDDETDDKEDESSELNEENGEEDEDGHSYDDESEE